MNERLRSYQTPPTPPRDSAAPFRSRFLRSSIDSAATTQASPASARNHTDVDNGPEVRPSVSSLRRRYDLNCNHVADSGRNSVRNSVIDISQSTLIHLALFSMIESLSDDPMIQRSNDPLIH